MDSFLEDDRAVLTLSDSENKSRWWRNAWFRLNNILIEPDIVESSDDSDGQETAINSVVVEISGISGWKQNMIAKEMEKIIEVWLQIYGESLKENTEISLRITSLN